MKPIELEHDQWVILAWMMNWLKSQGYRFGDKVSRADAEATKEVWQMRPMVKAVKSGLRSLKFKLPASLFAHKISGRDKIEALQKALQIFRRDTSVMGWSIEPMLNGNALFLVLLGDGKKPEAILELYKEYMAAAPKLAALGTDNAESRIKIQVLLMFCDRDWYMAHLMSLRKSGTQMNESSKVYLQTGLFFVPEGTIFWTKRPADFMSATPFSSREVAKLLAVIDNDKVEGAAAMV